MSRRLRLVSSATTTAQHSQCEQPHPSASDVRPPLGSCVRRTVRSPGAICKWKLRWQDVKGFCFRRIKQFGTDRGEEEDIIPSVVVNRSAKLHSTFPFTASSFPIVNHHKLFNTRAASRKITNFRRVWEIVSEPAFERWEKRAIQPPIWCTHAFCAKNLIDTEKRGNSMSGVGDSQRRFGLSRRH